MSQHVARDLITKIARAARYDGSSLSTGRWNIALPRTEVWNGSHGLHLDPQNFEIWRFSAYRPHNRQTHNVTLPEGGPIFGKATKVAIRREK